MGISLVAVLSESSEFVKDFRTNVSDIASKVYTNIDSLRKESHELLVVDFNILGFGTNAQFSLSKIRKKMLDTPILMVIEGRFIDNVDLTWFFDDFTLYPFRKNDTNLRIRKLVFHNHVDDDSIVVGDLKIDTKNYSVSIHNNKIDLTYKEFELLRLFVENRGVVFSRSELLNKIWGVEYIGGTRTVDVHIRRLRAKLGDDFNSIIETIRNIGYQCKE